MSFSSREDSATTRRGEYRQHLPETQSRTSRIVVVAELSVALMVIVAVAGYAVLRKLEDPRPPRIAGTAAAKIVIPAAEAGSLGDGDFDLAKGQMFYSQSCTSCHGQRGQGMPHQGISLRESKFIASTSDRALVAFIKKGRPAMDPKNTTGLLMPPRGGNPSLDDEALEHIVGYMRQLQKEYVAEASSAAATEEQTRSPATQPMADVEQERASLDSDAQ